MYDIKNYFLKEIYKHFNILKINNVKINIILNNNDKFATLYIPGDVFRKKRLKVNCFIILLNKNMNKKQMRQIAAHESRHIWQLISGNLILKPFKFFWINKWYLYKDFEHNWSLPFEIDARYYQQKTHNKKDKNKIFTKYLTEKSFPLFFK